MRNLVLLEKSDHQERVESFMLRMKSISQEVPMEPTMPSDDVLVLRAKLIFEEAMETIEGLGVTIQLESFYTETLGKDTEYHFFRDARKIPDLVEIVDGCCDLKVVTTGTLSACGVPDVLPQRIVDQNNLDKFAPGHTFREDGKLVKPPNHRPCTEDLKFILRQLIDDPTGQKSERLGLCGSPYAATVKRIESGSGTQQQDNNDCPSLTGQGPLNLD